MTESRTAPPKSESQPIAIIEKRDDEQVRISWGEFNGTRFLDLRIYFRSRDGGWLPTRKGVTIRPDQLDELEGAIAKAKRSIAG